jgi:hypothetical protein
MYETKPKDTKFLTNKRHPREKNEKVSKFTKQISQTKPKATYIVFEKKNRGFCLGTVPEMKISEDQ